MAQKNKKRRLAKIKKILATKRPKRPITSLLKKKEKQEEKMEKPLPIEIPIHRIKIKVIGIGGGGVSIVSEIASKISPLGKNKISFLAADTNSQVLKRLSSRVLRFNFGQNITHGLGTGMNPELGKISAQNEKEKIRKVFQGSDLYILIASLGGGTGSGAAPVFARISQSLGNLTFGIFTLPFKFEGEKKIEIARESLEKLKQNLNTISILPNERIFQVIDKKTPLRTALSVINKSLSESLEGLLEIIYLPGLVNIDFADLRTILNNFPLGQGQKRGKLAYLNNVEVEGADRVNQAIKKLIASPLYPYGIEGARGILFNITGDKNISLVEVSQISDVICKLVKGEAKIIFGVSQNKLYKDKIKTTLLSTDCKAKIFSSFKKIEKLGKPKEEEKRKFIKKPRQHLAHENSQKQIKSKKEFRIPVKEVIPLSQGKASSSTEQAKIRRNALQIKKTAEKEEEKKLAIEKIWEIPAFLRKKK